MIRFAAVPLLAMLAACSAEVKNGEAAEANGVDTLTVNNLVITDSNTATAVGEREMQAPPPAQSATAAEPKQAVRKPSNEAAARPASKPRAEPAGESETAAEAPADTCTAEHREMGHC